MTKSGKSVFFFGIYLLLIGSALCAVPDDFVSALKLPAIPSTWARIIGILALILSGYYLIGGRNDLKPFIRGTVYLRSVFFIGVLILFAAQQMPKEILPLGFIDLLGAAWTAFSLKSETRSA